MVAFYQFLDKGLRTFCVLFLLACSVIEIWTVYLLYTSLDLYPLYLMIECVACVPPLIMILAFVEEGKTVFLDDVLCEKQYCLIIMAKSGISVGCYIAAMIPLVRHTTFVKGEIVEDGIFGATWGSFAPFAISLYSFIRSFQEVIFDCITSGVDACYFLCYNLIQIEFAIYGIVLLVLGCVYSVTSMIIAGPLLTALAVGVSVAFKILDDKGLINF